MISKTPITKAMPHRWSVYHQCLIRCGITECSCCPAPSPDSVVMFHLTSLLSAAHLEMDIPDRSWMHPSRRPRTTWLDRISSDTGMSLAHSLALRFNGHFPGEPGLASVYWSKGWWRWWWQLDYWSYKSCKATVKSSPPTNQHPVLFLQAGCPSWCPTNSVKAPKEKYYILWTCLPQGHLGSSNFVSDH